MKEHARGFSTRQYTHSKENFMVNKLRPYKIFGKCTIFGEIAVRMKKSIIFP